MMAKTRLNDRLPEHLRLGADAENRALAYLQQQQLHLVERNFRCRVGEIDLIMCDRRENTLVFVEVRYRKHTRFGGALESVDHKKQMRLIRCATHYLTAHAVDRPVRFDVVAMTPDNGQLAIQWVVDAFQA